MKLKIAQVVGLNTDQKAAQVTFQERDEETFLAVLSLSCDDAFTKGRQFLSEISDFYFDLEGQTSEKLNTTFQEASQKLSQQGEFDLLLAAIQGKVLYLTAKGEVDCYLKRDGKLSSLLVVGSQGQLISGFLSDGDRIFLATKSLVNFLAEHLASTLDMPAEALEEEVSTRIGSSDQQALGLAGLILDVEQKEMEIPNISDEEKLLQEEPALQVLKSNLITSLINSRILKNSLTFFKRVFPKSGRGRLILAVVLLLIISAGVFMQYKQIQTNLKQQEINKYLSAARDDFQSAKGLATLNPVEAKLKLDSAKQNVTKALNLNPKNEEALSLQKQMGDEESTILKQSIAFEFPLFLDLDLVKKDFHAQNLSLSSGKLSLLDPQSKSLILVDVSKKSHNILAGQKQLGDASLASLNGNLVFSYSLDKGVVRTDVTTQKQTEVSSVDKEWGTIIDIAGFASNVYLLDSGKKDNAPSGGQIWKYVPTASGYSDRQEYLKKGVSLDFAGSLRMQIESSIYVLKTNGEMLRFTRGEKDNFSYSGLDKGVKDPKSFFVSSDTDDLYILDSGNSRVLILTKTGGYKGQISGEKFKSVTDLVVDEKGKKVYLLEGSKIYMVDLK